MGSGEKLAIWIGTKKGAFTLRANGSRAGGFTMEGPQHFGCEIYHVVPDPRRAGSLLLATRTGHLGPTVFRSSDAGRTWTEAERPPQFEKAREGETPLSVARVFWIEPGHATQADTWWAGVDIQGPAQPGAMQGFPCNVALFRSTDGGATWTEAPGLRRHLTALPDAQDKLGFPPGGAMLHSIRIDPRDARHLYVSISGGGTFESRDEGATWTPLNRGVAMDFAPDVVSDYGHDPHCLVLAPANPDRLWRQDHCGLYRLDRPGDTWERVGNAMPRDIGDIGFPIVGHPRDADTAWVFPMDGTSVWPRTSPGGKPAVWRTRDAGRSWERKDRGMPREHAWWTVYRQAMACDGLDPAGLYFGTTSGEVWMSDDEGESWRAIAQHLPSVLTVTVER